MFCLRSRRVRKTGRRNTDEEEKRSIYSGTGNDAVTGSGHGTGGNVETELYRLVVAGSGWKLAFERMEKYQRKLVFV